VLAIKFWSLSLSNQTKYQERATIKSKKDLEMRHEQVVGKREKKINKFQIKMNIFHLIPFAVDGKKKKINDKLILRAVIKRRINMYLIM
jgi:hypothetical protein